MKTKSLVFFKTITTLCVFMVFMFTVNMNAQNGWANGATIEHSANVNENRNNGYAGEGNNGNGVGNYPYGNQGSNDNPNGRTGGGGNDSIPLDGGLGILLLGAAVFGVKKLHDYKK